MSRGVGMFSQLYNAQQCHFPQVYMCVDFVNINYGKNKYVTFVSTKQS